MMEAKGSGPSSFGFHRLLYFYQCPRKFAYRWLLGLEPKIVKPPFALGSVLHDGLEAYYAGSDPYEAIQSMPAKYSAFYRKGARLVEAYLEYYVEEKLDVLFTEREFRVKIGGYDFTRKIDLGFRRDGKIWFLDHKTAARSSVRGKSAPLDWSLATQEWMGRVKFGNQYGGFILGLLQTTKQPEFRRVDPVDFSEDLIARIPDGLLYLCEGIDRLKDVDPWNYPPAPNCDEHGSCDYLPLCKYGKKVEGVYYEKVA